VSSDPSARAYGRRAEALAKEDMLRWVPPKAPEGPRLSGLRSFGGGGSNRGAPSAESDEGFNRRIGGTNEHWILDSSNGEWR
jgi:hypothetical protein